MTENHATAGAAVFRFKKNGLFASKQFLIGRLLLSSFIATTMIILASWLMALLCFSGLSLSLLLQIIINRRWRAAPGQLAPSATRARVALSVFDACMYALAAACLRHNHNAISTEFSLTILMITVLYSLMYFYTQPRMLLALTMPCLASLTWSGVEEAIEAVRTGHTVLGIVPLLGGSIAVYFLAQTRSSLDHARAKLVRARSDALAREEEARHASQAKSEFLATMGHEIRTPLNGVLGIAQVMAKDPLPPLQRERLEIISRSGSSLLAILNDLLDFSKIEAGKLELDVSEFRLSDVIKGAHATFAAAAEVKGVVFDLAIEPSAESLYRGDSVRLRQVFHNLISNAVKFTEQGRVRVAVSYDGAQLIASVSDTGIGVAPERLSALCEKFVQADASTTRRYGGTGLGLAIVSRLVQLMDGQLMIESRYGEGSTFTITVPLERLPGETSLPALQTGDVGAEQPPASALRILAADDNTTNQIVLRAMLEQLGIEVQMAANGQEAVEAWTGAEWDMILMDIQMPVMDGPTAVLTIRRLEAQQNRPRTPIIALTANAMTHQRQAYLDVGMDEVVAKPIEIRQLIEVMEGLLDGSQTQDDTAVGLTAAA